MNEIWGQPLNEIWEKIKDIHFLAGSGQQRADTPEVPRDVSCPTSESVDFSAGKMDQNRTLFL